MNSIGSFTLIKNEIAWIEAHIKSWEPYLDEMVFFDGNSTDGTLEILRKYSKNGKVKLFEKKDPDNLGSAYTRMFNDCLHSLTTDYAIFIHPDMILIEPGNIRALGSDIAYSSNMRSFAGDPGGQLYQIEKGRSEKWKNIYRLKNPDLGLHYYGNYGDDNEDCYFSKITGKQYKCWQRDMSKYPYFVGDSKILIYHYSDVRSIERRLDRMIKCLKNGGHPIDHAVKIAMAHPRITFKNELGFRFTPAEYPEILRSAINA